MKIILSPHGGSGNHGCEAIVRGTKNILKDVDLELFSAEVNSDLHYGLGEICKVSSATKRINRLSFKYLAARLSRSHDKMDRLGFAPILRSAKKCDLMMSIGGDNYCYGINKHILLVNRAVRKLGKKTVLWGCSIEPSAMDEAVVFEDLSAFTKILARESITYDALVARGLTNVSLYPDPAFQLERADMPLPEGFVEGNTIGINVSPMVIRLEENEGVTFKNYEKLIDHIISTTDMQVALIPHVVWSHNDDREPLRQLYDRFADTGRVVMLDDATAPELKGFIGRCRFFVAARTHASIAAYSQSVPTLVVGYSVKARGIARDIFGKEEKYVIPVQSFRKEDDLLRAFIHIYDNEQAIRNHYESMMGEYKAKAAEAGKEIVGL